MPTNDQNFLQWLAGIGSAILVALLAFLFRQNAVLHKRITDARQACVSKDECKEHREHIEKSVEKIEENIKDGFKEFNGDLKEINKSIQGVHERMGYFERRDLETRKTKNG